MTDPIGFVPEVIILSARTANALINYAGKVKGARKYVLGIVLEVKTLKAVLETLETTLDQIRDSASKAQLSESLQQCQNTLLELERLVAPVEDIIEHQPPDSLATVGRNLYSRITSIQTRPRQVSLLESQINPDYRLARSSPGQMSISKQLKWPLLQQDKADGLLERLKRHNSQLSLALDVSNTMSLNAIGSTVKDIEAALNDGEKRRVLAWLKPPKLDMRDFHMEQHDKQEDETCDWITNSRGWKQWLEGGSSDPDGYRRFIWINGIPGAGKTVLASFLIDEVAKHCCYTGVSYYYCLGERSQEETIPLLRWMVGDLSRQAGRFIPQELEDLYEAGAFTIQGLMNCLLAFCRWFEQNNRRVYLVVDAVDESQKPRKRLLDLLIKIGTDPSFENVSLLMTSRDEKDIRETMEDLRVPLPMKRPFEDDAELTSPFTDITMSNGDVMRAIRTYVKKQFARSSKFSRWTPIFREQVETELARNARGMFRWVACQIDILERLYLDGDRVMEALRDMPETLFGTYAKILENISVEQRPFAHTALALICSNTCNIKSADVLVQASLHNVQHGAIQRYDVNVLKECLGCLIKITDLRKKPERILVREDDGIALQKVSVAHYTVREFLFAPSKKKGEPRPAGEYALSDAEIRTLEMQVVFNGLQRWGRNRPINPRFATRYEEHCLEMSEVALREVRRNQLIKNESIWKSIVPCLEPCSLHVRELCNQRLRRAFPRWRMLFAFDELAPEANYNGKKIQSETRILASSILLGWPEFGQKFLQDPRFENLPQKTKQAVWTDRFTIDSAIDDKIPRILNKSTPMTLIRLCVVWKRVELLDIFLNAGANFVNEPSIVHRALYQPYKYPGDEDGTITGHLLKIILEAGADPDPPGFKYTPLQYAVSQLEEGWVQGLLLEGRDANSVGDPSGRHPYDGPAEDWHNQCPLEICETVNPPWQGQEEERERARRQVKQLLIQYGAQRPAERQQIRIELDT
ncbi:hypothetical protein F4818DRAFT_449493 [Hypoxylon cercidicola]|nr:hypothetical protein F4818DRAFT_449493 [Hypoxylon cercidicola]